MDEEDDYSEEEEEETVEERFSVRPQQTPISSVVGNSAYGFPTGVAPLMGESMCAAPPSFQLQEQEKRRPRKVPASSVITGPQNQTPTPFDPRGSNIGQVTSSYEIQNEIARPLSNIPIWQTPITPFSKARDTGPYDVGRSPMQLYNLQGYGNDNDAWRPKREQGPMFKPQPQNTFGMPAAAQVSIVLYQT